MRYLLRNFFHTLRHYRASSLLNITGMAVAFAAFYIILTQVRWGMGYNQEVEDADRIFLLAFPSAENPDRQDTQLSRPLAEQICSSAPGVESYGIASFGDRSSSTLYQKQEGGKVRKIKAVERQFSGGSLSTFGFEAEQGTFDELSSPGALAISSQFAQEYGLKVGDQLSANPSGEPAHARVVAIWRDKFQRNSCPGSIDVVTDMGEAFANNWGEWSWTFFVKLHSAEGATDFEQSAASTLRTLLEADCSDPEELEQAMNRLKISLVPFRDIYYRSDLGHINFVTSTGNRTTDITLLAVALLIILIAVINFINFFFALVPARVKSVNTYKVFGTPRSTLVMNFVAESLGLVLLSLIVALGIVVWFARSSASQLLTARIEAGPDVTVVWLVVVVALAVAVIGSIYPALYITSFQPALMLKGSFGTSRMGQSLRNVLIGVQFTISIALIICATFIKLQHHYMMNYDMGFDKEYLVSGNIPGLSCWWGDYNSAFADKLHGNPDIVDFTWANGQIVNPTRMSWGRTYKGERIDFQCYPVAYNFLDVMGIKVTEGRNFTQADEQADHGVMIFNEQARDQFGIVLDMNGPGHNGDNAEVAGICQNFQFRPLQYGNVPFAFYLFGQDHSWRQGLHTIYVRIAAGANPRNVMDFIRHAVMELQPEVDSERIELSIFDEELALKYQSEAKLGKQITLFTLIASILSLMGVFGLVFFETQHRKREIALRRVLGASVEDILTMFCRKYSLIVLICFVIASPLCYIILSRYLSNFAYHTTLSWWVFALALVVVLVATISIVVARCISTARSNPVDSIKTE